MVGVINANSSVNFPAHQADARQSKFSLSPGDPFPAEGEVPSGDNGPVGSTSSTTATSSPATTSTVAPHSTGGSPISTGAIAGIVIACLFVVALLAALFFLLGRQRSMLQFLMSRNRSKEDHEDGLPKHGRPEMGFAAGHPIPNRYHYYGIQPDVKYKDGSFATAPPQYPHPAQAVSPTSPPVRNRSLSIAFGRDDVSNAGAGGPWELPSRDRDEEKDTGESYGNGSARDGAGSRSSWREVQRGANRIATQQQERPTMRSYSRQESHPAVHAVVVGNSSPDISDLAPSPSSSPKPQSPGPWPERKASSKTA
ncbi:uncharacterized protein KY384_007827 [Bacidia gigantensis]|uniref:uncharacterized protein n=1 Tax=Bacidia gigantensis TaxID=2732470 RepID=UPI001D050A8A|nr:uncharacterized protein KY384_007827 [Bacidia gigantensis]KAG8527674.1 hypothetical protein KY384_007827 [Bacidia gigantensis]